jgi:hypothetical protein
LAKRIYLIFLQIHIAETIGTLQEKGCIEASKIRRLAHDRCRFPLCGGSCSASSSACAYFPFSLCKLIPSLVLFYTSALLSFVFDFPSPNFKLFPLLFQFKALNYSLFQFRTPNFTLLASLIFPVLIEILSSLVIV